MKPGDMIEWVYKRNNEVVPFDTKIWSSPMNLWVPIGKASLLISITDETYTWLNDKGLFHARVDDTCLLSPSYGGILGVVPRAGG